MSSSRDPRTTEEMWNAMELAAATSRTNLVAPPRHGSSMGDNTDDIETDEFGTHDAFGDDEDNDDDNFDDQQDQA